MSLPRCPVSISGLIRNSSFIFALAVILGLLCPAPANRLEPLVTPALLMMMVFSMIEIDLSARGELKGMLIGFGLNYIILSGLILALSSLLGDENLRQGFVVMAAVPPAVAVLPLTKLLQGDARLSLYAEGFSYLASIVLMPGIIFASTSRTGISFSHISEIVLPLILLPIILSRFLKGYRLDTVPPINLGFFLVTYVVIGLNTNAIFGDVTAVAFIAFIRTFVIGAAVYYIASLAGLNVREKISYCLLASFKNLGMAAAVSLMLFGPKAGIPAAVCILAETFFYIFFSTLRNRGILK